jgi:A/G-specific adenine glycosylase
VKPVAQALLEWYRLAQRDLPWRRTTDPYRIWVSEVMLQQTRSQTVIPYYERFLERYPTVEALAAASEADVLALWSGLGYYSRARNLLKAARKIVESGGFPRDLQSIRALPGAGEYTAAAVASIAFGLAHAVVDGNVLRVIARVENDAGDIGSPRTRERFQTIADRWLDPRRPGEFNQAMMELGATVCLPRNPLCLECPLSAQCRAYQTDRIEELPVKLRKTETEQIAITVLVIRRKEQVLLRRRPEDAQRMAGFWELPAPEDLPAAAPGEPLGAFKHSITHHRYTIEVRPATISAHWKHPANFQWFPAKELAAIPLSTIARKALRLAEKSAGGAAHVDGL